MLTVHVKISEYNFVENKFISPDGDIFLENIIILFSADKHEQPDIPSFYNYILNYINYLNYYNQNQ